MGVGRSDEAGAGTPPSIDALIARLPEHLPELIVLLDEDGSILWCNLTSEAVLGWRRDEWIGRNIGEILHPDDAVLAHELLVSARATGPGVKEPVSYRVASTYDGWIEFEAVASTVHLADGRSVLIVSARVKGRSRRDDVIAGEVGERMSFVFDEAVVGMAKVGLDGRVLQANRALGVRVGVCPTALHGVALVGLVDPSHRPTLAAALTAAAEGTGSVEVEVRFGPDAAPARLHLTPVPDWLGVPMYLLVQVIG